MTHTTANVVEMDRRANQDRRQAGSERRTKSEPVAIERRQTERRKTPRRRQIDPTTCERDYSNDEIEFMQALDQYKRDNGRMFPTCSEILEVIRSLGYAKTDANDQSSTEVNELSDTTDEDDLPAQSNDFDADDLDAEEFEQPVA